MHLYILPLICAKIITNRVKVSSNHKACRHICISDRVYKKLIYVRFDRLRRLWKRIYFFHNNTELQKL